MSNVIEKLIEEVFADFQNGGSLRKAVIKKVNLYKKTNRFEILLQSDRAVDIKDVKKPQSFILVVGNEANGVDETIIASADIVTKIEIKNIDSLNVAIATGILMDYLR